MDVASYQSRRKLYWCFVSGFGTRVAVEKTGGGLGGRRGKELDVLRELKHMTKEITLIFIQYMHNLNWRIGGSQQKRNFSIVFSSYEIIYSRLD